MSNPVCSICFEGVQANPRVLPCQHGFHVDCINLWEQGHNTCPTCRAPIDPARVVHINVEEEDAGNVGNVAMDIQNMPQNDLMRALNDAMNGLQEVPRETQELLEQHNRNLATQYNRTVTRSMMRDSDPLMRRYVHYLNAPLRNDRNRLEQRYGAFMFALALAQDAIRVFHIGIVQPRRVTRSQTRQQNQNNGQPNQ